MFKDTSKISVLENYFGTESGVPILEVVDYIRTVDSGLYAREPIAYALYKIAKIIGLNEPIRYTEVTFRSITIPFETEYRSDYTLPRTMKNVIQEGVNYRYVVKYEQDMYGQIATGHEREIERSATVIGQEAIIAIGTMEWVNVLLPSNVNKNFATNILVNDILKTPQTITDLTIPLELQQIASGAGFEIENAPLIAGNLYTLSFKYQVTKGTLNDILSFFTDLLATNIYIDGELVTKTGTLPNKKWVVEDGKHEFYMHIESEVTNQNFFSWRFNYEEYNQPTNVWVTNLSIHEGHIHPFEEG